MWVTLDLLAAGKGGRPLAALLYFDGASSVTPLPHLESVSVSKIVTFRP